MFTAFDKNKNKVSIENALKGERYYCPICLQEVLLKKGKIRAPHFSHKINANCTDWGDMSEWHLGWQEKFPLNCREVILENNGIKHRADILLKDKNIVIEFQHSQISNEDFNARNKFYTELGFNLIWVFDGNKKIKNPDNYEIDFNKIGNNVTQFVTQTLEWKRYKKDEELLQINHKIVMFYEVYLEKIEKKVLLPVKNFNNWEVKIFWLYDYIKLESFLKSYSPLFETSNVKSIEQINYETQEFYRINNIQQKLDMLRIPRYTIIRPMKRGRPHL